MGRHPRQRCDLRRGRRGDRRAGSRDEVEAGVSATAELTRWPRKGRFHASSSDGRNPGPGNSGGCMRIRIVLAFTTLLVNASPAWAALELIQPSRWTAQLPAEMADLEEQLRKAHFARIDVDGHSLVLRKPRV